MAYSGQSEAFKNRFLRRTMPTIGQFVTNSRLRTAKIVFISPSPSADLGQRAVVS